MDGEGKIAVSGTVDPHLLLQTLQKSGKILQLCSWQYGQCHSNLYMPESKPEKPQKKEETHVNDYYGYGGGYYGYGGGPGGYGGYGFVPQPIYPFRALEAPPDATHRTVPDDEPKSGGQADLKALETENEPKSGVAVKQCCSIM
ncbi:hypothetical protein Vadar_031776 [Vaccinium darrowii]|uniref:Uncharacterized protein n=1 Tax=Vaccinium darrowii TaxID=229202 RepID=A0ACB7Z7W5_9ERIC|nr:hypothetical protein Vadar_031776 [Vaccinium darrowii]